MEISLKSKIIMFVLAFLSITGIALFIYYGSRPPTLDKEEKEIVLIQEEMDDIDIADTAGGDVEFTAALRDTLLQYPWFFDFPVDTNRYVIVWIIDREQFRIRLKLTENSDLKLVEDLTNEAVLKIEELTGMNIGEDDYFVVFLEE
jgi:hypothetical protein